MPEINLPTYEQIVNLVNLINSVDTNVNSVKTITNTINTNTATANLGAPATAASNATSAVAHAKLNWLLSVLGTVNTNTATANLGAPATAASNAVGSVAHAKLNWLLSTLASVNTNTGKRIPKVLNGTWQGSTAGIPPRIAEYTVTTSAINYPQLNVTGKGVLKAVGSQDYCIFEVDGLKFQTTGSVSGGYLDIPFATSLKVQFNSGIHIAIYELY